MFIHLMLVWRRREIRAVYTDKKGFAYEIEIKKAKRKTYYIRRM